MGFEVRLEEAGMRVVTGGDWSIGLGSDSSLGSALLNTCLGEGLREIYSDAVEQPLPAEFRQLLKMLSKCAAQHESGSSMGAPESTDQ